MASLSFPFNDILLQSVCADELFYYVIAIIYKSSYRHDVNEIMPGLWGVSFPRNVLLGGLGKYFNKPSLKGGVLQIICSVFDIKFTRYNVKQSSVPLLWSIKT